MRRRVNLLDFVGILDSMFLKLIGSKRWKIDMKNLLRGSGYLGYVDSNQGYNPYKWVISPLTRVINLHITSYLPYPEPLSMIEIRKHLCTTQVHA